jgi:predicted  nucleic acid-binding Zn-ribbon protein
MYATEYEASAEHLTIVYDKLDSLERKMDYEFENIKLEFRRSHLEAKDLKGQMSRLESKFDEMLTHLKSNSKA